MPIKTKAHIEKAPWNKNKAVGQKAPFTQEQIDIIRHILTAEIKLRDLALFNTAISTMLRASGLLNWHDNYEGAPADGSAWMDDGASAGRGKIRRWGYFSQEIVTGIPLSLTVENIETYYF